MSWDRDWRFNCFRTQEHKPPEMYSLAHAVYDVGVTLHLAEEAPEK